MHYVDRGLEPRSLKRYADDYTPRWVEYYVRGKGSKPSDSYWRKFQEDLSKPFSGLCGYCETECKGEVDHFRPKSRFPQRVYDWSNWVFSCHDCNHSKGGEWPRGGYVDPCARIRSSRPEQFFDFDLKTGEIIPKFGLTGRRWDRARIMIEDLKLNAFHHLRARLNWISMVLEVLKGENEEDPGHEDFVQRVSTKDNQFSSITRVLLAKHGYFVGTDQ